MNLLARIVFLLAISVWGRVEAAEQAGYAVLALIGNQIAIVHYGKATGSNLDRNVQESYPLPDASFDKTALLAIDGALRRAVPEARVILLEASNSKLYELQDKLLESGDRVDDLLVPIRHILEGTSVDYLVLLTKCRHDARFKAAKTSWGSGKVAGMGFYIDSSLKTSRSDTNELANGFLAPFAYFRMSLVDARTMKVIREENGLASYTYSAASSKTPGDPWDIGTPKQKVAMLNRLLKGEINRLMPLLLEK